MRTKAEPTQEQMTTALYDLVREMYDDNAAWMLEVPGVEEIMSEYLYDDVMDKLCWDHETNNNESGDEENG